jgi:hypothetical protein
MDRQTLLCRQPPRPSQAGPLALSPRLRRVVFTRCALFQSAATWALSTRCRCTTSPVRQLLPWCEHAMTQSCSGRFERAMVIRRKLVGHEHHRRCGSAHRSIVWHVPRCDIPLDEPDGTTPYLLLGDLLNGRLDFFRAPAQASRSAAQQSIFMARCDQTMSVLSVFLVKRSYL